MSRATAGECNSCRVKTVFQGCEKRLVFIDNQFCRFCSASLEAEEGEAGDRSYFFRPGLRPLVSFTTAASAFPWASQRNQLRPKPRSVLWNSRLSTYLNELGASTPKWYVLIISDLQDKPLRTFSQHRNSLFRCRWRTHRSAVAKTLYDIANLVRELSSLVQSARLFFKKRKCNTSLFKFKKKKSSLQIFWCQVLNVFRFPVEIGCVRLMKSALEASQTRIFSFRMKKARHKLASIECVTYRILSPSRTCTSH